MNPIDAVGALLTEHEFHEVAGEPNAWYTRLTIQRPLGDPYDIEMFIRLYPGNAVNVKVIGDLNETQHEHLRGYRVCIAEHLRKHHGIAYQDPAGTSS